MSETPDPYRDVPECDQEQLVAIKAHDEKVAAEIAEREGTEAEPAENFSPAAPLRSVPVPVDATVPTDGTTSVTRLTEPEQPST
jgi:hypothetical protein